MIDEAKAQGPAFRVAALRCTSAGGDVALEGFGGEQWTGRLPESAAAFFQPGRRYLVAFTEEAPEDAEPVAEPAASDEDRGGHGEGAL